MLYDDAADTPLILLSTADPMVQWASVSCSCIIVDRRRQSWCFAIAKIAMDTVSSQSEQVFHVTIFCHDFPSWQDQLTCRLLFVPWLKVMAKIGWDMNIWSFPTNKRQYDMATSTRRREEIVRRALTQED